jgi:membrane-associated phospholipid phosphatase
VVAATLLVAAAAGRPVPVSAVVLHLALLAGYAGLALVLARRAPRGASTVRGVAVVATMFTLYGTLGHAAFQAVPWRADPWLAASDRTLFLGWSPVLAAARLATDGVVEALSFFYAAFIPYLYLSILLGLVGRPDGERAEFVTGFAVLYALSFLGYLFAPARGPIVEMAGAFDHPLHGGALHRLVLDSVERMGGPHGAFPSLHVGASSFAAYFDWRHENRLRALIYLPLVVLIALATLVLRYHYALDLVAGVGLAVLANRVAPGLVGSRSGGTR